MNSNSLRWLAVASAAAVLTGCSSSSDAKPTASASQSGGGSAEVTAAQQTIDPYLTKPTQIAISKPLSKKPASGKTIYVIALSDPNVAPIVEGITAAGKTLGWNTKVLSNDGSNPAKANSQIIEAVQDKADFIANIGAEESTLATGIAAAKAKNIPFFPFGVKSSPQGTANWIFSNVDSNDNFALKAKILADYVIAKSGAKANIALVNVPAFAVLKAYGDAYEEEIKTKCSGCSFHAINLQYADVAAGKTASTVVAYLRSNPKVDNLNYATGSFAIGLEGPAAQAGLKLGAGGITVTVQSPSANNLDSISKGTEQAALAPPLVYDGWTMVDAMARQSVGDELTPNWEAKTPFTILTKDSVTGADSKYAGPDGYDTQFKTLWGV